MEGEMTICERICRGCLDEIFRADCLSKFERLGVQLEHEGAKP